MATGFLFRELRGSLHPWTEGRRFSSRDALPCARKGDQWGGGEARGGVQVPGLEARQGQLGRQLRRAAWGLQQERVKCADAVQY